MELRDVLTIGSGKGVRTIYWSRSLTFSAGLAGGSSDLDRDSYLRLTHRLLPLEQPSSFEDLAYPTCRNACPGTTRGAVLPMAKHLPIIFLTNYLRARTLRLGAAFGSQGLTVRGQH